MNYYISDTHFGHKNILAFDNRPFYTTAEMEREMIQRWNAKVKKNDTTYILGDFCRDKESEWTRILNVLNGSKALILGNHDLKQMSANLKHKFQDITHYKEITDNGRKVIMSHYPMPFYKSDYNPNIYHLYGHVHNTIEEQWMQKLKKTVAETDTRTDGKHKLQYYNCWCGFYNYTPATLDEIINVSNTLIK